VTPELPARYRFHPLERRGLLLGLGPSQLATVAVGVVGALFLLRRAPGATGLLAGMAVIGVCVALACWPIAGRSAVAWGPVAGRWVARRGRRTSTWRPDAVLAPAGVALVAAPAGPGDDPLGVVHDRVAGTWSAVLAVGSGSFSLLDPDEKARRLAAWGAVLASAARAGSPIHRLQWVERTGSGRGDALAEYLAEAGPPVGPRRGPAGVDGAARASYLELIGDAGAVDQAHELLLVLSVHPRRAARQLRAFGRGPTGICALLRRELRLLQGQLRGAEVQPGRPLDVAELSAAVRFAVEPKRRHRRRSTVSTAWPMAVDEGWASVHVDDRWHATYWIAEWPRMDVGADFLAPLLVVGGTRVVSLTMAPVAPARAVREVESARTADLADQELRRRAGFLSTARHRRAAEGAVQREAELADGHGDYRFSGYVSASATSPVDLDGVCAQLEQAAQQSHLDLRRLYGQQLDALTWTMPLGRGLS
jgi:hypothetical protein